MDGSLIPVVQPARTGDQRKGKTLAWREVRGCCARERKLPIGSGEIESAHRHLVQKRLKLAGAWWKETNAQAPAHPARGPRQPMLGLLLGQQLTLTPSRTPLNRPH